MSAVHVTPCVTTRTVTDLSTSCVTHNPPWCFLSRVCPTVPYTRPHDLFLHPRRPITGSRPEGCKARSLRGGRDQITLSTVPGRSSLRGPRSSDVDQTVSFYDTSRTFHTGERHEVKDGDTSCIQTSTTHHTYVPVSSGPTESVRTVWEPV